MRLFMCVHLLCVRVTAYVFAHNGCGYVPVFIFRNNLKRQDCEEKKFIFAKCENLSQISCLIFF